MAYDDRALRGVGGWLAFFVLTLAVLSPLRAAMEVGGLLASDGVQSLGDRWPIVRGVALAEAAVGIGVCWFLAWRLVYVQTPATPRLVIGLLWFKLLVAGPLFLTILAVGADLPFGGLLAGGALGLGQAFAFNLIWTLYLRNSVRVANTYTSDEADDLHAVFE